MTSLQPTFGRQLPFDYQHARGLEGKLLPSPPRYWPRLKIRGQSPSQKSLRLLRQDVKRSPASHPNHWCAPQAISVGTDKPFYRTGLAAIEPTVLSIY